MAKNRSVWAVELWEGGHWKTAIGGLNKPEAKRQAKLLVRQGETASIAEYTSDEGSSAIHREAV
jgi:hypothetical protein